MDYDLYIDVLFVVDYFFEVLVLSLAASLLKRRLSPLRAAAAAGLGAMWTCLMAVFPVFPLPVELCLTVLGTGSAMAAVAFKTNTIRGVLLADAGLLAASVALSGGVRFFTQFTRLNDVESLVCLTAVFLAAKSFSKFVLRDRPVGQERYQVKLYYRGNMRQFLALTDSGNRLKEPESGKPVSVISYADCAGFCEKVSSFLYIPYRAVGTESGLLPGIIFERMEILKDGKWLHVERPIVAVAKEPLSARGDFTMLLPEELVL